ncbi:peptidase [Aminobacter sp. Y103A]|uniref:HK97 family phage prohead protease n=1 Tax=Aminobacter sp. Y103A TaxID=1870862 RepID=UPI0025730954|nr:HK97 family phage prohead protease [Aminobacter sp. SS-2016]BBD37005.1 peptidase [Aminobacter sp. SS-2016]
MSDITGFAIQWNQPAIISGLFEERFAPGAFDDSLTQYPDVAALWSHDASRPLGRVSNGTLQLRSTRAGLWYSLTPNPDSPLGKEATAAVGSNLVNQVSVGFSADIEEWEDTGNLPKRTITRARLYEISIVLWGAYGEATSASLRNADNAARRIRAKAEAAHRLRGIR